MGRGTPLGSKYLFIEKIQQLGNWILTSICNDVILDANVCKFRSFFYSVSVRRRQYGLPIKIFQMGGLMAISIKDIAKAADVSYATVSRALTGRPGVRASTRQNILTIAQQLGYVPNAAARRLVTRRTSTIGVIVTTYLDYFYAELLQLVTEAALERNYRVVLASSGFNAERELDEVQALRQERIDAFIVIATRQAEEYIPVLEAEGIPVVVINQGNERPWIYAIETNNSQATCEAVEYLISLGHRRIGYVAGQQEWDNVERQDGYLKALQKHGLPYDPTLIVAGDVKVSGGKTAFELLRRLDQPPTAVCCYNDETALGVLNAAYLAGIKVPEELSVIGFDDIYLSPYAIPPLTTIRQPKRELAYRAVEVIVKLVEGYKPPRQVVINSELVVRQSTAPPRSHAIV
jgi:DNA-binding LacI/PurR family transcriptional regulator